MNVQEALATRDCKAYGCTDPAERGSEHCAAHATAGDKIRQLQPAPAQPEKNGSPKPSVYTCKVLGCEEPARSDRGPYSRCDKHRGAATTLPRRARGMRRPAAPPERSLEQLALEAATAARRFDKAKAARESADRELAEAAAELGARLEAAAAALSEASA